MDKVAQGAEAAQKVGSIAKELIPAVGQQPVGWAMLLVGIVALLCMVAMGLGLWFMGRHVQTLSKDLQAQLAVNKGQADDVKELSGAMVAVGKDVAVIAEILGIRSRQGARQKGG
jgi:type II secretory pathway component PulM